ncbi:Leucine zipper transcription factor-like protein 1 [Acropora cervicornis]|uniref:Leucine zipper transcription factor-like protein 1 n=1 Tax=Acropora cervicornis TaxID=6130 RepID=A0AAD9QNZ1_ACRCE|nr:Leucine zipper transcription factor-like protein 1 [Acropora cervicornis]
MLTKLKSQDGHDTTSRLVGNSLLVEDTYTLDEVTDMLDGLCSVVRGEVESELINSAHTNVLLLRQVFSQAEKWHLKLQADISELENRDLIEEIAKFEEREFSTAKSTSQAKFSKLSLVPKLEPLNEGGGAALLQLEINRLNEENTKLRDRIKILEGKATSAIGERSKLQADLENTQAALKAKSSGKTKEKGLSSAATLQDELTNCKHEILKLQHDLEEAEKDLAKKFNETSQYRNMKQMLASKNEQIKDLRSRLRKYV